MRTSFAIYEHALGVRARSRRPRFDRPSPVPTIVVHGARDAVVPEQFVGMASVAFTDCIGPFTLPDAGHFLPWERPQLVARTLRLLG